MSSGERFTVDKVVFDGYCIQDNLEEYDYTYDKTDLVKLCALLNRLHDENLLLKSHVGYYQLLFNELEEMGKKMSRIK